VCAGRRQKQSGRLGRGQRKTCTCWKIGTMCICVNVVYICVCVCKCMWSIVVFLDAIQVDKRKVQAVADVSESLFFSDQLIWKANRSPGYQLSNVYMEPANVDYTIVKILFLDRTVVSKSVRRPKLQYIVGVTEDLNSKSNRNSRSTLINTGFWHKTPKVKQ